jgi:hypothetical protein
MRPLRAAHSIHYLLAVIVLATGAVGMQVARSRSWLVDVKKPLSIRKPLRDFDRACLAPLRFASATRLDEEMEIELGTTEYINWNLSSPSGTRGWRDPVFFSVTYYTGKQDQVPHVPEECLWQGGLSPAAGDGFLEATAESGVVIPVHRVAFYPREPDGTKVYDYYTIRVNGGLFSSRNACRPYMAVPWETHLYYSKVEVMFQGVRDENLNSVDQAALKLLRQAVDELLVSHYPLKGWEKGGPPAVAPASPTAAPASHR